MLPAHVADGSTATAESGALSAYSLDVGRGGEDGALVSDGADLEVVYAVHIGRNEAASATDTAVGGVRFTDATIRAGLLDGLAPLAVLDRFVGLGVGSSDGAGRADGTLTLDGGAITLSTPGSITLSGSVTSVLDDPIDANDQASETTRVDIALIVDGVESGNPGGWSGQG